MTTIQVQNNAGKDLWFGAYNLSDDRFDFTLMPWGGRRKVLNMGTTFIEIPDRERVQVVFWERGFQGKMVTNPKAVYANKVAIARDENDYYVYNHHGNPETKDKIDHIVVLMLENRSFDNVLGWLYSDQNNIPPRNLPKTDKTPTFDGLIEGKFWNTPNPADHDNPDKVKERVYVRKGCLTFQKPNPNPKEVCPSFVEQMFGTESPADQQKPNMWGFLKNYSELKDNKDVNGIMECYTRSQLPVLSDLAKKYSVCDRWFGSLPCETFPNRSFVHAGTSFGRLNNMDGKYNEGDFPDVFPPNNAYVGKRTIFDVLQDMGITWGVYQAAMVVASNTSYQFWNFAQKLKYAAKPFWQLDNDLLKPRAPKYIFVEPGYFTESNDQHPPAFMNNGEVLINDLYNVLSKSGVWNKTLLIITYDEHGGCYDHVIPPSAIKPDDSKAQFAVGQLSPFEQFGPRVPAVVISPYIEEGTVFRSPTQGVEFDHTSILATIRDWIYPDKRDILGDNKRIKNAPTLWPILTRLVARKDKLHSEAPMSLPADEISSEPGDPVFGDLTDRQLGIFAAGLAEHALLDEIESGILAPDSIDCQQRFEFLKEQKLQELHTRTFMPPLAGGGMHDAEGSYPDAEPMSEKSRRA